jgi:hypothetical protein
MSYLAMTEMASSQSLIARVAAAAAAEGLQENPVAWTQNNIWKIVAADGWADVWSKATDTKTVNVNPDTGARNDVIGDDRIQKAVRLLINPDAAATKK